MPIILNRRLRLTKAEQEAYSRITCSLRVPLTIEEYNQTLMKTAEYWDEIAAETNDPAARFLAALTRDDTL
ncbi:hypothetical protein [Noviherbaspirillum galbum]|uniref:Uncharacterized protein n=1 Tax=Noviherbaspirillum galbum TaxID=2709383 RepID=A0A6B3SV15_9BURK|nr:hypothetical protein [Noviherbaspirillum galbum]NEX64900.1 hypothetical protein [Noviherbaspirillum galbum]